MAFEDVQEIDGMDLIIDWDLKQQFAFIFEVPTDKIEACIPKEAGVRPMEARPGVGLLFLGYNDYNPGNLINGEPQPAFLEITRFFWVQPDLSVDMPIPRFTFFVDRIASNNHSFIKQEIELLHLPTYETPSLRVETNEDKKEARAFDDQGPIQDLINTHPAPTYIEDSFYGQYYTMQGDHLWFGVFYWSGIACVHQSGGPGGGIHTHPFLTEKPVHLDPSDVGTCYMQMIAAYDSPMVQRFYRPRMVW